LVLSRIDWARVVKKEDQATGGIQLPQNAWSPKRERQYEHIKESLEERGTNEDKAEEIAARTVNKERARHGETNEASRTSIDDISSGRRGGLRSHKGSGGRTYDQLRNEARERGIKGRSTMRKDQLEKVLSR
jgi:plasmid stabilization system protein ParE